MRIPAAHFENGGMCWFKERYCVPHGLAGGYINIENALNPEMTRMNEEVKMIDCDATDTLMKSPRLMKK